MYEEYVERDKGEGRRGGGSASEVQEDSFRDGLKKRRIRRGMDSFRFSCSVDGEAALSLLSLARKERDRYEKTTR